jgi:hypothetical protein
MNFNYYYILLLLLLNFSCTRQESHETISLINSGKWEIQVTDTLEIAYSGASLVIVDFNEKYQTYLGYDTVLKIIFEFNSNWEIINEWKLETDDYPGYGKQAFGLTYYQDSLLAVAGIKGFYFYSKRGELLQTIFYPEGTWPSASPAFKIFTHDNKIISLLSDAPGNHKNPIAKHLSILDMGTHEFSFFGDFPEGSIYLNEGETYYEDDKLFSVGSSGNVYLMHQLEPLIQVFNSSDEKINAFNVRADNFSVPRPMDSPDLMDAKTREILRGNSWYIDLHTPSDSLVILEYYGPANERSGRFIRTRYMQVFHNHQWLSVDMEFKPPYKNLFFAKSDSELYFTASTDGNTESDTILLYRGKLIEPSK